MVKWNYYNCSSCDIITSNNTTFMDKKVIRCPICDGEAKKTPWVRYDIEYAIYNDGVTR